jgi:hypothetical protein
MEDPMAIKKASRIVIMQARVRVSVGDLMIYPYSLEVAAGEPSEIKAFHSKYAGQVCRVAKIPKSRRPGGSLDLEVRFSDGTKKKINSDFLQLESAGKRPKKKKSKKK